MSPKVRAANKAINALGGAANLAESLLPNGSKQERLRMQSRIAKWRVNGVAPRWVLAVESATGVSRQCLAPDLYPAETAAA